MPPTAKATTRDFIEIADIRDTVVILKNGSLRSVLDVSSINFDLKSQDEQNAIVQGFQSFVNYVDFPLEITISSKRLDIGAYLKSLEGLEKTTTNELLKVQLTEYSRFIKGLTDLANIMSKKFYVTVPFYIIETAKTKKGFLDGVKNLFNSQKSSAVISDAELETYKAQLNQRISVVMGAITSLGLSGTLLNTDELRNLYYSYYNPGQHL